MNDPTNGLPYSGKSVQAFIKKSFGEKVGCWCWSTSPDTNNYFHLWGFATEADKQLYLANSETYADLLLVNEALHISTVQGDSYNAYLWTNTNSTTDYIVNGNSFVIGIRFAAVRTSSGERLNLGMAGTLIVQRKTSSTDWTTVATLKDVLASTDYSDSENYANIDLGSYLSNGTQQLRIKATVNYTDDDGNARTATSTLIALGSSITKTTISLTCQLNWQTPIYASAQQSKGYPISYMVYGAVAKTLHVEITGGNNSKLIQD